MRREAGGGRARGRGRLWRGNAAAWARGRKTTEEEARWAGLANWADQAAQEQAAQGGKRQVGFPFLFLFYFSDICFDLVIILNHFIYLCKFL